MKKRRALLLPLIVLGLLEIFFVVMMILFWGKIVHPIGAVIFGLILTVFFIMSLVFFINPDKYYSDGTAGVDKFYSQLFGCEIKIDAGNESKEYVEACIKFFNDINMSLIVEKAHEDLERFKSVGTIDGIEEMEEIAFDEGILDLIKIKVIHLDPDHASDPEHVRFIAEGEADWCDGFEIMVIDGKVVHIGEYTGDYSLYQS